MGGFNYGNIDVAECSVTHLLCKLRQVKVEVVGVMSVDALAQVGAALIGGASANGICACKGTIDMVVG